MFPSCCPLTFSPSYRNLALYSVQRSIARKRHDALARLDLDRRSRDLRCRIEACVEAARRFNQSTWF